MFFFISRLNSRISLRRINFKRKYPAYQTQVAIHCLVVRPQVLFCNRSLSTTMAVSSSISSGNKTPPTYCNRLINEKSPYLLQHAHNPVDWYPWGEEALSRAKRENKLIFLSIGYSTCHWCHVMEQESFEDEETAKIMNEKYVCVKVDREERPEIDKLYMTFILLINGSGGWPLSIFLTPDLAPVTGGTYFPKVDRWGIPGFKTILAKVANKWETSRDDLTETGLSVIEAIKKSVSQKRADGDHDDHPGMSLEDKFNQAVKIYRKNMDAEWGGAGKSGPKFPEVSKINFLFHAFLHTKDKEILDLVLNTLDKIANGGIHDHVFGGFARYSVDRKWHVPHFEKMLYDQGQLLMAYSNAYKITRCKKYLNIADKIFKYITKDLYHPGGGFFAGEDADSLPSHDAEKKIEGAFYAWDYIEIEKLFHDNADKFSIEMQSLKPFDIFCHHYDIEESGNVEPQSDPHGHLLGKNILFVSGSLEKTSNKFGTNPDTVAAILEIGNEILHNERQTRPRPHLDRKIITSWNGLVLSGISKLACSSDAPNRLEYLKVAKRLIDFVRTNLYDGEMRKFMRACYVEPESNEITSRSSSPIYGFLDDYAFLIKGLIDYYVASLDVSMLYWAKELQDLQDTYFWDSKNGGYFYSEAAQTDVVVRMKEDHDGAEPAGNSVAAQNLILLGAYFEDLNYKKKATEITHYFSNISPMGYVLPEMLSALLLEEFGLHMLVVVGPDNDDSRKLINVASDFNIPGLISILHKLDHPNDDEVTRKSVTQFKMVRNMPTLYMCHRGMCHLPITNPDQLAKDFAAKYLFVDSTHQ